MVTTADESFEDLLTYLKEQRGLDFTGYKRASLQRRVRRRMTMVDVDTFEEYHDYLEVNPDEYTTLFNTILINVTGFFRDAEAWSYLRHDLLPDLLEQREGLPIRAWSAGCASGEEAYTLAMVLAEALGIPEFRERVKIYATDIDEEALAVARQATYTERAVRDVPDDLREKYFERHGQRYSFLKELRRSVIFGRNDLVQNAPISHVDLLCCRNTLMYLNAGAQSEVLERLHFALRPDGILFLGKAEMLLSHTNLFRPLELKRRFFRKSVVAGSERRQPAAAPVVQRSTAEALELSRLRHAALMSTGSAQLVLDLEGRLALSNTRAGYLFGTTHRDVGRRIQDLEVSYRPVELRPHLDDAIRERRQVWLRDVAWVRGPDDAMSLDIQIVPLTDENGVSIGTTVIYNDVTRYRQLQHELEFSNRQLETAYEELQSTNEELETTNEELQSTNEELETMNEELQSMNDELHLSNSSLRERQDEVDRLNRFMSSVLGSLRSGVAVIGSDLRVRAWNATATELWGIREDEATGEHLFNLDIGLPLDDLKPVLRRQFADGAQEESMRLAAVNRRGRPLQVEVTVSRLTEGSDEQPGAILLMDVLHTEPAAGSDGG